MKILIVLGHPNPGSLNHAIAHAVRDDMREAGHDDVGYKFPLLGRRRYKWRK
jgi:putative NADPH-quinone reductase